MRPRRGFPLLVLVAACGGGGSEPPADAGGPDADPTAVTVRVLRGGQPLAGAAVVVHSSDGLVQAEATTAATGDVVVHPPANGMITVASSESTSAEIITATGVSGGEELIFVVGRPVAATQVGMVTVNLPSAGVPAGAATFSVNVGCRVGTTDAVANPVPVALFPTCLSADGKYDVLATAFDQNMVPLAFASVKGSTPQPAATLSLGGSWNTTLGMVRLTLMNGGPLAAAKLSGVVTLDSNGILFANAALRETTDTGVPFQIDQVVPTNFAGLYHYTANANWSLAPFVVDSSLEARVAPAATLSVDMMQLLPRVEDLTLEFPPADMTRPRLRWTSAGSLAAADGGALSVRWVAGAVMTQWTILVPGDAAQPVQLPALPDGLAPFRPIPESESASIVFFESDQIAGYPAFRRRNIALFEDVPPSSYVKRVTSSVRQ